RAALPSRFVLARFCAAVRRRGTPLRTFDGRRSPSTAAKNLQTADGDRVRRVERAHQFTARRRPARSSGGESCPPHLVAVDAHTIGWELRERATGVVTGGVVENSIRGPEWAT